ncbi:DUF3489 domain-containing protein [Croceicoccus ponticola]|uniref:DUF3489 domain-containing protein n=1 Tax=Croceicoccus ponticola TaxID=2217664 RepID=A0A437GWV6_9SPHN|nr:DUF3489 domain-containing protein [Croceicoccus ponticola]
MKKPRTRKYARQLSETDAPEARCRTAAKNAKPQSKSDTLVALLSRGEGATLDDMIAATGWLPHTTRAALTGLRKKGHDITSEKVDGVRTYRIMVAA